MKNSQHRRIKNRRRRRKLQIELLESRFVLNGQALLAGDSFSVHENGPKTPLAVLANDSFDADYAGAKLITSVSFGSQGGRLAISADKQQLLYTPPADFFGTETFSYSVDGRYTGQVQVNVEGPLAFDQYTVKPDGAQHVLDVLGNDPFWSGYTGTQKITSVSVGSAGGTITIAADQKSILYTPGADTVGQEIFTYVVDGLYPAKVTINIPSTLNDDRYEFVKYEAPATLDVTANDPFWAGYTGAKKVTQVESSQLGATIQISSDGRSLTYTQPTDFGDQDYSYAVYDTFHYVVDGKYEASVTVALYRPVKDDQFSVDENSVGYFYNVTANDTYYDALGNAHDVIDRVTSVTQSSKGGTVTISADGQGILYTPAAGFSGDDDFTYIADGAHEARVAVHVTRPVRDDFIVSGVYQDTPNAILNVLNNDFLGNGYAGPRLITSVGLTEHGGTVAVRSDGKAIIYTPAVGYIGEDHFTYTVDGDLQANVDLQVIGMAQNDNVRFYPDAAARPYTIDVLANDWFSRGYAGPGVITSVEVVDGSGQVSVVNGKVVFDAASAGAHTLRYSVDGQYQASVFVWIENVAFADQAVVGENSAAQNIDVLWNDFYINCPPYSYSGPRLITGVTQSQHGGSVSLSPDGKTLQYRPATDFVDTDTFTYTVDNFMTATVTVQVIRRVRDDQFRVDAADGPQVLPVLVNDPFGADYSGPGQITAVTATAGGGTVSISGDGHSITYQPRAGFVGTDTFTYTVDGTQKAQVSVVVDAPQSGLAQKFASVNDYVQFLINDALTRYANMFGQTGYISTGLYTNVGVASAGIVEDNAHSETNVQVAGVDEGDLVEFDSNYIYMLSGNDVVIVNAWPADQLSIASRFTVEGQPIAEYLNGDRLTIISTLGGGVGGWSFPNEPPSSTVVTVLDVSNRNAPTVVQKTKMDGQYVDSRAVGGFVYVLVNNANAVAPAPLIIDDDNDPLTMGRYETRDEYLARVLANSGEMVEAALPNYTTSGADGQTIRTGLLNSPEDVYQPLVDGARNILSVVSFSVTGDEPGVAHSSAVYSTGASTIYASLDHFYVFDADITHEDGAVTRILKFDWQPANGGIEFDATTTVPGTIINQFSVDDSGPYLRIATTVHNYNSGNWSGRDENVLFVLAEDDGVFEYVGGLHNLALGESIRSVTFLGDRAFITTFRDVDPLFAIDLSDPAHPESVGHITIPGYTSYMQLIDQNHLLTVGRNTPFGGAGPTEVALFDISDLLHPQQIAEYTFERFSTSEAELDHHAFGYYSDFGLLAMPVSTQHVERVDLDGDGYRETSQIVNDYQLAVFSVDVDAADPANRLTLKSEIEHDDAVRRSGFIGDKLYSIADGSVKVVDIAAPDTVIAQLTIPHADSPVGNWVFPILEAPLLQFAGILEAATTPTIVPTPEDSLATAVAHAREAFAKQMHTAEGEPILMTAEASPSVVGGFSIVLQSDGQNYVYQIDSAGAVILADADFHFSETVGAWHAVESRAVHLSTRTASGTHSAPAASEPDGEFDVVAKSTSNGAVAYFARLGNTGSDTHHQSHTEAFRKVDFDSRDLSLLVLSAFTSHSDRDRDALFDNALVRSHAESATLDLSDIDEAFGSLATRQTARRLCARQFGG